MADDEVALYIQVHSQASLVYDREGIWRLTVLPPSLIIFGEQPNIVHAPLGDPLHWNSMISVKPGTLQVMLQGWFLTAGKHGSISTPLRNPSWRQKKKWMRILFMWF